MAITDLSNLSNSNSFSDLILFLNQNSNGMFFAMFVISLSIILIFILSRRTNIINALWVSATASTILCFIFMMASFLNWIYFMIYLVLTIIITFVRYTELG